MAQDERSCVVYGMPKEAVKLGAADSVIPLAGIPGCTMSYAAQPLTKKVSE